MRALSPTLLAEQKKPHRTPHIEAKVYDYEAGIKRLHWTRLYQGTEPHGFHGLAFDGQGHLHRIRHHGVRLYYQKQLAPFGSATPFPAAFPITLNYPIVLHQWTQVSSVCAGPCAIAAFANKVYIFYCSVSQVIKKYYSHDYGETWQEGELYDFEDEDIAALAACWWGSTATVVCFVGRNLVDTTILSAIVLNTENQYRTRFDWLFDEEDLVKVGGIGATFYPHPLYPFIAVIFVGQMRTGNGGGPASADGGELEAPPQEPGLTLQNYWRDPWSHSDVLITQFRHNYTFWPPDRLFISGRGSDIFFRHPECHRPANPQDYETTRIIVVEEFIGYMSYARPLFSHLVKDSDWLEAAVTEPQPLLKRTGLSKEPENAPYGLRMASTPDSWYVSHPSGLWSAPRHPSPPLDISADILAISLLSYPLTRYDRPTGGLTIELDNSKGRYNQGAGIVPGLIDRRSEVVLKLGYRTPEGPEASQAGIFWIDSWEYASDPNTSTLTIKCLDGWGLLERWVARHPLIWNQPFGWSDQLLIEKPTYDILRQLIARVGIHLTNIPPKPRSDVIMYFLPRWSIYPGTQGDTKNAVRWLLSMAPDHLVFTGHQAFTKDPRPTETPCYTYGTDHTILAGRYKEGTPTTAVRIRSEFCLDHENGDQYIIIRDAFDWDAIQLGIDIWEQTTENAIPGLHIADAVANAQLRQSSLATTRAILTVPPNVAQEPLDVIVVSDPRCGIADHKYRVMEIVTAFDRRKHTYEQKLILGPP